MWFLLSLWKKRCTKIRIIFLRTRRHLITITRSAHTHIHINHRQYLFIHHLPYNFYSWLLYFQEDRILFTSSSSSSLSLLLRLLLLFLQSVYVARLSSCVYNLQSDRLQQFFCWHKMNFMEMIILYLILLRILHIEDRKRSHNRCFFVFFLHFFLSMRISQSKRFISV